MNTDLYLKQIYTEQINTLCVMIDNNLPFFPIHVKNLYETLDSMTVKDFIEHSFKLKGVIGAWHGNEGMEEFSAIENTINKLKMKSSILARKI